MYDKVNFLCYRIDVIVLELPKRESIIHRERIYIKYEPPPCPVSFTEMQHSIPILGPGVLI